MSQQNSAKSGSSMNEAEYAKKLDSKNIFTQIGLLRYNISKVRFTPPNPAKKQKWFRLGIFITGVVGLFWTWTARKNVMRLKNDDYGIFLADQEMRKIRLQKEL